MGRALLSTRMLAPSAAMVVDAAMGVPSTRTVMRLSGSRIVGDATGRCGEPANPAIGQLAARVLLARGEVAGDRGMCLGFA